MARRPALPAGRTVREGQSAVAAAREPTAPAHATLSRCAASAAAHAVIDPVQPVLRAVSDLQDTLGLALLAILGSPHPWGASVVPGRLDEQPASEPRSRLGDRALVRCLAGLVKGRDQPEPRAQRVRSLKALPVPAELEMQRERCQGINAPEAAKPRDGRPPLLVFCQARVAQRSLSCGLSARRLTRSDQRTPARSRPPGTVEPRASAGERPSRSRARDRPGRRNSIFETR